MQDLKKETRLYSDFPPLRGSMYRRPNSTLSIDHFTPQFYDPELG